MKTSGGCIDPACLDELTHYGAEDSSIRVGYVMRLGQPVAVIVTDIKRIKEDLSPEHMHFSVEDWRLFATALCSGLIPVPQLVTEYLN